MKKLKKLLKEYMKYRKRKKEEALWYSYESACFGLFPPSFYYTLSEEELFELRNEELKKIRKMLWKYKKQAGY